MVLVVVDDAELTRRHAMYLLSRIDHITAIPTLSDGGVMVVGSMAYLERHVGFIFVETGCEEMKIMYLEFLLVRSLRVVTVTDVQDILFHILLDDKPGTAAQPEALALADGVEPESTMAANALAGFPFYHVSGVLTQVSAYIFVVVYLPQEADTLAVATSGVDQMLALGYPAHLVFLIVTYGEERLAQLPVVDLGKKVGLVFDRVGAGASHLRPSMISVWA